jgi:hypothetical protein
MSSELKMSELNDHEMGDRDDPEMGEVKKVKKRDKKQVKERHMEHKADNIAEEVDYITTSSINGSDEVHVNVTDMTAKQHTQLKVLKKMIKQTRAYSLFYYERAGAWRIGYWVTLFIPVILAAATSIVNIVVDKCSDDDEVRKYNIIINAIIAGGIAAIALIDASSRRRLYELAGDDYSTLSMAIYRSAFTDNAQNTEQRLSEVIERFSVRMDDYARAHNEPPFEAIDDIMKTKKFGVAIKFKTYHK